MIKEVIQFSYDKEFSHIPSALSMLTYIDVLFRKEIVKPYRDRIVLGKPFGSQAYYTLWKDLGHLQVTDNLSIGVKHDEIDFVDYSEETMGNALGVAAGIAMATDDTVWVNLTDATLQMGSTLEAIQFIGHRKLKNLVMTVDYNDMQVTGKPSEIIPVDPVIPFLRNNNWDVCAVNGHDQNELTSKFSVTSNQQPTVYICNTIKGYGVSCMEDDPVKWHYKKIDESDLRQILKQIQ